MSLINLLGNEKKLDEKKIVPSIAAVLKGSIQSKGIALALRNITLAGVIAFSTVGMAQESLANVNNSTFTQSVSIESQQINELQMKIVQLQQKKSSLVALEKGLDNQISLREDRVKAPRTSDNVKSATRLLKGFGVIDSSAQRNANRITTESKRLENNNRKEIRSEISKLKKLRTQVRNDIRSVDREIKASEKSIAKLDKEISKQGTLAYQNKTLKSEINEGNKSLKLQQQLLELRQKEMQLQNQLDALNQSNNISM